MSSTAGLFGPRDWMRELWSAHREEALLQELIRAGALSRERAEEASRRQAEAPERRPLEELLLGWVDAAALAAARQAVDAAEFARVSSSAALPMPDEVQKAASDPERQLGDYILVLLVGSGGMGEVWKAWDRRLSRWVAIKISRAPTTSRQAWERFQREVRAAGRLHHPGIVPVHAEGESNGKAYIVMQYIEGETLDRRRLSLRESLAATRDVALALHHAHGQRVVHRDVKPGNILLDDRGAAWILDFGIAHLAEAEGRLTAAGSILGTAAYMPPEQARGEASATDAALDVYGLGATLYDLATGHPPFAGESFAEIVQKVCREEPPAPRKINSRLPRDVETVILKAMDKDPRRRYASAAEFAEDVRRCLAGEPILARPASFPYRAWKFLRRHRLPSALGATAAAALVVAATFAARAIERSKSLEVAAREKAQERERYALERDLALRLLRETTRVSLEAALVLRRQGANERLPAFLEPLESAYRQALERAPELAEVDYRMGRMHRALMKDAAALEFQNRALAKDPDYAPALYERAVLLATKYAAQLSRAAEDSASPDETAKAFRTIQDDCTRLERILAGGPAVVPGTRITEAHLTAARGILAFYQGRSAEAARLLTEAVESDPLMEEAWEALAKATLERPGIPSERLRREGIALYARALGHDQGYVPLLLGRGQLHMAFVYDLIDQGDDPSGDMGAAERDFSEAVRLSPENGEAWLKLADLRSNQGFWAKARGRDPLPFFEDAESRFSRALELDPAQASAWRGRGILRTYWARLLTERREPAEPRWSGAVDDFTRYAARVAEAPEWRRADALMRRATALAEWSLESGTAPRFDAAERDFEAALRLDPGQARIWSRRGAARLARAESRVSKSEDPLADFERAERDLSKAIQLQDRLAEAWVRRGLLRSRRARHLGAPGKDVEAAAEDLTRAIELNKGALEAWSERALLRLWLVETGEPKLAKAHYEMAAADIAQVIHINPSLSASLQEKLASSRNSLRKP